MQPGIGQPFMYISWLKHLGMLSKPASDLHLPGPFATLAMSCFLLNVMIVRPNHKAVQVFETCCQLTHDLERRKDVCKHLSTPMQLPSRPLPSLAFNSSISGMTGCTDFLRQLLLKVK